MSLLTQKTTLELDLDSRDQIILQAAEATHHLAAVLSAANERYWSLPPDRLLAVLNADVRATLMTFQTNTALATAINASLNALNLPQFPSRAPTLPGRSDVHFDGERFYIPTPEPEVEPETEPEPEPEPETEPTP